MEEDFGCFVACGFNGTVQTFMYEDIVPSIIDSENHRGKIYDILSLRNRDGYVTCGEDSVVRFFAQSSTRKLPYLTYKGGDEMRDMIFFERIGMSDLLVVAEGKNVIGIDVGEGEDRVKKIWTSNHHSNTVKKVSRSSINPNSILLASYDNYASEVDLNKFKVVLKKRIGNLVWTICHLKEDSITAVGTGGLFLYSSDLSKRICKVKTNGGCDIPICHLSKGHYLYTGDDSGTLYIHDIRKHQKILKWKKITKDRNWIHNMIWVENPEKVMIGGGDYPTTTTSSNMIAASCQDGSIYFIDTNPSSSSKEPKILKEIIYDQNKRKIGEIDVTSICQIYDSHNKKRLLEKLMKNDILERIYYLRKRFKISKDCSFTISILTCFQLNISKLFLFL